MVHPQPAVTVTILHRRPVQLYWTSTTRADYTSVAWFVYLDNGVVGQHGKTITYYVWPVRGGQ